jgi:hypothetical protein
MPSTVALAIRMPAFCSSVGSAVGVFGDVAGGTEFFESGTHDLHRALPGPLGSVLSSAAKPIIGLRPPRFAGIINAVDAQAMVKFQFGTALSLWECSLPFLPAYLASSVKLSFNSTDFTAASGSTTRYIFASACLPSTVITK